MSKTNETQEETFDIAPTRFDNELDAIDNVTRQFFGRTFENHFRESLALANAVKALKTHMPDNLVIGIKKTLENTSLGFKTDKEEGYPITTIKKCLIESALRGLHWNGNEFNIIADNTYVTREGFTGMMNRDPRFSDLELYFDPPEFPEKGKAIVICRGKWKFNGVEDELEARIPVKLYSGQGDDVALGKANRKFRARIWERVTGKDWSDGDVESPDAVRAKLSRNGNNGTKQIDSGARRLSDDGGLLNEMSGQKTEEDIGKETAPEEATYEPIEESDDDKFYENLFKESDRMENEK